MLTIRFEQLKSLHAAARREFPERLTEHLMTYYPSCSAAIGERSDVFAFAERTLAKAQGLRIDSTGAVLVLAELMLQFGEDFERSPIREWTRNILAHRLLPGAVKVEAVRERHTELTQGRVIIRF